MQTPLIPQLSGSATSVPVYPTHRPTNNADPVTELTGAVGARPSYFEYTDLHDDMAQSHTAGAGIGYPMAVEAMIFSVLLIIRVLLVVLGCRNLLAGCCDDGKEKAPQVEIACWPVSENRQAVASDEERRANACQCEAKKQQESLVEVSKRTGP